MAFAAPAAALPIAAGLRSGDLALTGAAAAIALIGLAATLALATTIRRHALSRNPRTTFQRRHAEPGEIMAMFREIVGPDVPTFPKSD